MNPLDITEKLPQKGEAKDVGATVSSGPHTVPCAFLLSPSLFFRLLARHQS